MRYTFISLLAFGAGSSALSLPLLGPESRLQTRKVDARQDSCENTATSRSCWGNYSIDTNYYDVIPDTGVTREYWLSVEEGNCAPDGFSRPCMTFNGTVPGPTIFADWGDELVIHVANNMETNGTSIHWHGIRQLGSSEYDGVPGVTQCPIAPGTSMTYQFKVQQYGSTWYHSHFSLQYADGLFGGMVLNGPATADYDEDLGVLFLNDWGHVTAFEGWVESAKTGAPPTLANGLVNGTNTWDGAGAKFETVFETRKKYRFRLINSAVDSHFQFSIDGHNLTVIGNDLVPIKPYSADSVLVGIGQRYDVIVEATAGSGDFWLRSGWNSGCGGGVTNGDDITGIIRYNSSSTADPTSSTTVTTPNTCVDEPYESLIPYLSLDVGSLSQLTDEQLSFTTVNAAFQWTINTSSLYLDWSNPTLLQVMNGESIFPTDYNVVAVDSTDGVTDGSTNEWAVLVIEDQSKINLNHPIHMHGHDFWVVAQSTSQFDGTTSSFDLTNPPRRDVATLPGGGYLALAFKIDNPGAWIIHCHIAWHASQGLALEFVESESAIDLGTTNTNEFNDTCTTWNAWDPTMPWPQDDSGI